MTFPPSDLDGDGTPEATDTDLDGDGTANASDECPRDPTDIADADNDQICDNADQDDDNDGVPDSQDLYPNDPLRTDRIGATVNVPAITIPDYGMILLGVLALLAVIAVLLIIQIVTRRREPAQGEPPEEKPKSP